MMAILQHFPEAQVDQSNFNSNGRWVGYDVEEFCAYLQRFQQTLEAFDVMHLKDDRLCIVYYITEKSAGQTFRRRRTNIVLAGIGGGLVAVAVYALFSYKVDVARKRLFADLKVCLDIAKKSVKGSGFESLISATERYDEAAFLNMGSGNGGTHVY